MEYYTPQLLPLRAGGDMQKRAPVTQLLDRPSTTLECGLSHLTYQGQTPGEPLLVEVRHTELVATLTSTFATPVAAFLPSHLAHMWCKDPWIATIRTNKGVMRCPLGCSKGVCIACQNNRAIDVMDALATAWVDANCERWVYRDAGCGSRYRAITRAITRANGQFATLTKHNGNHIIISNVCVDNKYRMGVKASGQTTVTKIGDWVANLQIKRVDLNKWRAIKKSKCGVRIDAPQDSDIAAAMFRKLGLIKSTWGSEYGEKQDQRMIDNNWLSPNPCWEFWEFPHALTEQQFAEQWDRLHAESLTGTQR